MHSFDSSFALFRHIYSLTHSCTSFPLNSPLSHFSSAYLIAPSGYSFLSLNSHFSPSDDEKIIAQAFSSPGFLQYENVNLFYGPSHTSPKELKAVYLKGERQGNLDKWVYVTDTSFPPSWLTEKEPLTSFGCSRE